MEMMFKVSDDETELTISYVTKHDDGTYSCMAGNTVGSMTADARLSVTSHHHKNDNQITDDVIREAVREASYNVDRYYFKQKFIRNGFQWSS